MKNVTLNVSGMSCGHCVNSIEGALKTIGASGKVNLSEGTVAVAYDESKLTHTAIKEAIEDQGYDVEQRKDEIMKMEAAMLEKEKTSLQLTRDEMRRMR